MASAWGQAWGRAWGNSWGTVGPRHPSHGRLPPSGHGEEIRRAKRLELLVLAILEQWRIEFAEFLPEFLSRWMPDRIGTAPEIVASKVREKEHKIGRILFDELMAGTMTEAEMQALPNPYIADYSEKAEKLNEMLNVARTDSATVH